MLRTDGVLGEVVGEEPRQEGLEEAVHVEEEAGQARPGLPLAEGQATGLVQDADQRDGGLVGPRHAVHLALQPPEDLPVEPDRGDGLAEQVGEPPRPDPQPPVDGHRGRQPQARQEDPVDQAVLVPAVVDARQGRLDEGAPTGHRLEVDPASGRCQRLLPPHVRPPQPPRQEFLGLLDQLPDQDVLEPEGLRRVGRGGQQVEVPQPVGVAEQRQEGVRSAAWGRP